ncbi:carbon-nitrogen hydrolase family protein [Mucilaginibacter flavidus]|uniref:carbon-nitrogen hydrolase family protein n=1 Tax=Mucilaginibacter flavidus TaxID=2949309 RepID=UPI00209301E7|nr:carbon-nitrogen hydrolase family protein [Mucilaginibacter flavidus]MCO5945564.1 carbon-nitrogen hydrolase family protein [Mucilaginibacter flavidus]
MKVAVASPPFPKSINDCLYWLEKLTREAAGKNAAIICFPESFIPGYPLEENEVEPGSPEKMQAAVQKASSIAAENNIAIILPMDWYADGKVYNIAHIISRTGEVLGYQAKNQLDPTEDSIWSAGSARHIFEVDGVKFGVTICHEGFRYPESVRWAARNGAQIVFHPHCTGSNIEGPQLTEFGHKNNPYYEKAMMMRALENTIYFASSNYASLFPDSASALIAPDGKCVAHSAYGRPDVFVAEIDLEKATGLLAKRLKPENYY